MTVVRMSLSRFAVTRLGFTSSPITIMRSFSMRKKLAPLPVAKVDDSSAAGISAFAIFEEWKDDKRQWEEERKRLDEERKQLEERRDEERTQWDKERQQLLLNDRQQAIRIVEMKNEALHMLDDKIRFGQGFNIRGGLERICYKAVLDNLIPPLQGVQQRLDALAHTVAFAELYEHEIAHRRLTKPDVERCRKNIYHEVSKHAHGNQGTILIRVKDFTPNEVAAVVAYYKLQDKWNDALDWEEVPKKDYSQVSSFV